MALTLLDSSAVVGFLYGDDALHRSADAAIRAAANDGALGVSAVTVVELLTGIHRGHHDAATVRRFLTSVAPVHHPVDDAVAARGAELRGRARALRLPDALILATGDLHADAVVTGDLAWSAVDGLTCRVDVLRA